MFTRSFSNLVVRIATFSGVALATAAASAQTTPPNVDAPQAASVEHGSRLRFGAGLTSGLVTQQEAYSGGAQTTTELTVIGLELRLGVQLDDRFAVFYQGNAAFGLAAAVRNGVLFEVTPRNWLSIAAGVSVNYFDGPNLSGMFGTPVPDSQAWSLGVPVRLALNLPFHRSESGRRLATSLSIDLTPAYSFGGYNLPAGFQLGSVAGLSFEMY